METNKLKIFLNTVFWGFILWFVGYILGIIFYMILPANIIGWIILPFGVIITVLVLLKEIERSKFSCYIMLGIIWTIMAAILDYIFIVKLFGSNNYYKLDVYVYYALTFLLPVFIGWYKTNKK